MFNWSRRETSVHVVDIGGTVDHWLNNKELTIQRHRQHWEQNTEQRKSKNKTDPGVNSCAHLFSVLCCIFRFFLP